jgi:hypothetical protein
MRERSGGWTLKAPARAPVVPSIQVMEDTTVGAAAADSRALKARRLRAPSRYAHPGAATRSRPAFHSADTDHVVVTILCSASRG